MAADGIPDGAHAGAAGAFLAVEFTFAPLDFAAGFGFVGTLAPIGEDALHIQPDEMLMRLKGQERFGYFYDRSCGLAGKIVNGQLHRLFPNEKEAFFRAGDSPGNDEDIFFGDDLDHLEVVNGDAFVAIAAGEAFAFPHTAGEGIRAHGAGVTLAVVLTVRAPPYPRKVMPLHHPRKTPPLRPAHYRDDVTLLKDRYRQRIANLVG
jgi:hypothetical protein